MTIIELPYTSPSRLKSWITIDQIENDDESGKIFLNKLGDVLFTDKYNEQCKSFVRSILDFLIDWEFISWKQYDSIMAMRPKGEYLFYQNHQH
jgi:hypothetical protein